MQIPTCLHAGVAATGIAVASITAVAAAPLAPVTHSQSPPTVARDVRLAAATVPLGGLVTSFLGNQVIYCSLICPLLVQTAVTPVVTTLQTPGTFLTALQSGNLSAAQQAYTTLQQDFQSASGNGVAPSTAASGSVQTVA